MKLDERLFVEADDTAIKNIEKEDEEARNLSDLENKIAELEIGDDEIVIPMKTPVEGITDKGFNTLHIIKRTPTWYKIWNEDDDGDIANEINFSTYDNTIYWATLASQGTEIADEIAQESLREGFEDEYDQEDEGATVSTREEGSFPTDEAQEQLINGSYRNQLIELINDEWETIKSYNDLIAGLRIDNIYEDFIPVIEEILTDEHNHVGALQNLLDKLNPQSQEQIEDGEKESQEILDKEQ